MFYQFVDPLSFAVMGPNGNFRNSSFTQFFNPSNTPVPFFQVFDKAFLDILGPNAAFHEVAANATFAFAHEAPIFSPDTDEVFFASNDGGPLGMSDINHNNKIGKISMKDVDAAFASLKPGNVGVPLKVPVTEVSVRPLLVRLILNRRVQCSSIFLLLYK